MLKDRYPRLEKTVFIVTYGRSGSTLLQSLLNGLPGALIRGENENLLAPLARAWDILRHSEQGARMREKIAEKGRPSARTDPWFGYEDVTADAMGAALTQAFVDIVLRPAPDTRIAGFKEIRWHRDPAAFPVMLDLLRRHFPQAHFLFNLRDHAAVAQSGWWATMKPDLVRRELERAEALYAAYARRHTKHCLTLRYDELVGDIDAWRPLFAFLDEPFDADLVSATLSRRLTHLQPVRKR